MFWSSIDRVPSGRPSAFSYPPDLIPFDADHADAQPTQFQLPRRPLPIVDGPGPLLDDVGAETLGGGVDGGAPDAVVGGQADDEDVDDGGGAQGGGQARVTDARVPQRRVEGAVHLDGRVLALLDDAVQARDVQVRQQGGAGRALDAVHGPQARLVGLARVGRVGQRGGRGEGRGAGVAGGEGDVAGRVPVLGCDLERERQPQQAVGDGHDGAAVGHGQRAVGRAEVFLDVDDDQRGHCGRVDGGGGGVADVDVTVGLGRALNLGLGEPSASRQEPADHYGVQTHGSCLASLLISNGYCTYCQIRAGIGYLPLVSDSESPNGRTLFLTLSNRESGARKSPRRTARQGKAASTACRAGLGKIGTRYIVISESTAAAAAAAAVGHRTSHARRRRPAADASFRAKAQRPLACGRPGLGAWLRPSQLPHDGRVCRARQQQLLISVAHSAQHGSARPCAASHT